MVDGLTAVHINWRHLFLLLGLLLGGCESLVEPASINGCPTPSEPYLYPTLCRQQIDAPLITRIVFDPPGGKVPLRVRFLAEAQAGLREFDNSLRIHWDLDGDSKADATTLSGDSFYFDYETCTTIHFQVWAEDDLGKVSDPLKKALFLACNKPPVIFEFSSLVDLGPPGTEVLFTLKAVDQDAEDPDLINGIKRIEWDFDGDGAGDIQTDGRPVVFPQRYLYGSVGIFRPKVRVYDEDGLFTESDRLQIQILGTSSLLQQIYSVSEAQAVVARGDLVATFFGSGITFRRFNGTAMQEVSQVRLSTTQNSGAAALGDLWLVSESFGGGVRIWNARDATDVTASTVSPHLLHKCNGGTDYADPGSIALDANSVGITQTMVGSSPVTVAVMNRRYNPFIPVDVGEIFLADMSAHASVPVTDNADSSCPDGSTDLIPAPRRMKLHNTGLSDTVFIAQQVTAETDLIYASTAYTGLRAYYWPAFWNPVLPLPAGVSGTNPPLAASAQSVFTFNFQALTIAADPARWYYGKSARVYSDGLTEITVVLPRSIEPAAPVTVSADGWPLPATWVAMGYNRHELRIARTSWDAYALASSDLTVDFLSPAHIMAADASPTAVNSFVREAGFPVTLTRVAGIGITGVATGGSAGEILFYKDWIIHAARGAISVTANNGLFVAPVTQPHVATRIGTLEGSQISDIAIEGNFLYVAASEKGVQTYDLSALLPGEVPAVSLVPERSYLTGSIPQELALDVTADSLWVGEGRAGLRNFVLQPDDTLASDTHLGIIGAADSLALDAENRRLYVAGGTEVVSLDADSRLITHHLDGFDSLECVVHRRDAAQSVLALCDRQPNQTMRAWLARASGSTNALDSALQGFTTPPEVDAFALGPVDVPEPRLFASGSNGVFVYCTDRVGAQCPEAEGGLLSLPEVGVSPTLFPYRSASADLLVSGARAGVLSFWDFTHLPTLVGKVSMCDPEEMWLPASACTTNDFDAPLDIADMDVVAPYAFLGTSWGVFGIDLRAAPILRTGSFYLGVPVHHVAARYDGNGAYVVYAGTDEGIAVFRFAQFEPAE